MPGRGARLRVVLVLACLAALAVPAGATAADLDDRLDDAKERRQELRGELTATNQRVEELRARIHRAEQDLEELDQRQDQLAEALARADEALSTRARSAFMHGGDLGEIEVVVSSAGSGEALERAGLLDVLAQRGQASVESATTLRTRLAQTERLTRERQETLEDLRGEASASSRRLDEGLAEVSEIAEDLQARKDKQREIDDGAQQGTYACMMADPYSYVDSWGDARSGGRGHKGTDVMAPHDTEVYAFTDGTVSSLRSGGLGGTALYLDGDDGNRFYYAHLAGYADSIAPGTRVEAGELVAYNGDTGNARGGAPHVHFEVRPGGGAAVNPYPWLRPVCP